LSSDAPEILSDTPGFGQLEAKKGDLVLVHYTGELLFAIQAIRMS
jgi:hypothetical protein